VTARVAKLSQLVTDVLPSTTLGDQWHDGAKAWGGVAMRPAETGRGLEDVHAFQGSAAAEW
jgi:hypothetical protein